MNSGINNALKNTVSSGTYCKLRNGVVLAFVTMISSACAHMEDSSGVKGPNIPGYVVPFSFSFDREGNPVVFDQKGKKIQPSKVEFPVKAEEIKSIYTASAVQVKGSCFSLLEFGGLTYQIPLPDTACEK